MFCKNCGKELNQDEMYCSTCGFARGEGNRFCPDCGAEVPYENTNFCTHCGANLRGNGASQTDNNTQNYQGNPGGNNGYTQYNNSNYSAPHRKSRLAAGLLQIFLGGFGIGRFYLGYTSTGVYQLLVSIFTCGIGSIWGFIDGILILTGSVNVDANGNPLSD